MTTLHWESAGSGEPVLMIMGLGLSGGAWWRTVDALSPARLLTVATNLRAKPSRFRNEVTALRPTSSRSTPPRYASD